MSAQQNYPASKHSKVKTTRLMLGITQQELAERSGISQGYLSQIERGNRQMLVNTLCRIGKAMGVPTADLLPDDENDPEDVKESPVKAK